MSSELGQAYFVDGAIQAVKNGAVDHVDFYCVITPELGIPDSIKEQYGTGEPILLKLTQNGKEPEFNAANEISWGTSFNGVAWRIYIDLKDVVAIAFDGGLVRFTHTEKPLDTVEDASKNTSIQKSVQKPDLKLVVDNSNKEYTKTAPKGNLELVKG